MKNFRFNDLTAEAQVNAMDNLRTEEEYQDRVNEEADNYIRDMVGRDVNLDWKYDGENITFYIYEPDIDFYAEIEKICDDIEADAVEILDGNNETVNKAWFTKDGKFVKFE
jgi:hypothetical protein